MVRYVGIARETTYGIPDSTCDKFIDVVSESVKPEHETLYPEHSRERWAMEGILGAKKETGSFDMIVRSENICELLKTLFGQVTTTDDGGTPVVAYKHEFTPASSTTSFTLHIGPEVGNFERMIAGTVVTSIEFEARARELLTATVNILGTEEEKSSTVTPSFTTVPPFVFTQGTVTMDGADVARVESIRLAIENDIPDDAFVLGQATFPGIYLQGFKASGSMDIAFIDWTYYDKFLAHGASSIVLDFTGVSTGSSEAGFENHKITFNMPKCYFDATTANFDRRDRIVQSLEFTAVHDDTLNAPIKVTVINTQSTIA